SERARPWLDAVPEASSLHPKGFSASWGRLRRSLMRGRTVAAMLRGHSYAGDLKSTWGSVAPAWATSAGKTRTRPRVGAAARPRPPGHEYRRTGDSGRRTWTGRPGVADGKQAR